MVVEYLKELFGEKNIIVLTKSKRALPIYLMAYDYQFISIFGQEFVFVEPKSKLNIRSYKVQRDKIEQIFMCRSVLVLNSCTTARRKNLMDNNIMFVRPYKQLFMPILGVVLSETSDVSANKAIDNFTPQIQLCAMFFVYAKIGEYTVKNIENKTGLNQMAISRAMAVLVNLGAVKSVAVVRTKYYSIIGDKKEYLKRIEPFLINPVQREVMINSVDLPKNSVKAGYTVLAHYSMIQDDLTSTYAVSKTIFKALNFNTLPSFEQLYSGDDMVKLQVWKYDPLIFAEGDCVDKLSLLLTFTGSLDERTEEAINNLKEDIFNG